VTPAKQQALVAWIVWFAMFQAAFIYPFFLGNGFPRGPNAETPMGPALWLLCLIPIVVATAVRWLLIPKLRDPKRQLVAMIIGLALSEAPILLSIFLMTDYPQNQIAVLMLAVVSLIQFAPSYATPGFKNPTA